MLLMIDNYDSFTFNIVQYFGELGAEVRVVRNDEIDVAGIESLRPDHLVISPGPCTPNEAGICLELVEKAGPEIPLLGVCLGHQTIGQVYGGKVVRAGALFHGKTSVISNDGTGVFAGLPDRFTATRYHSLTVDPASLPNSLSPNAHTDDGTIMGLRHAEHPVHGVQFHPESIASEHGHRLIRNFLDIVEAHKRVPA